MGHTNVFDKMDTSFLIALDDLRENAGVPLQINSSYRSRIWNKSVGGASRSFHLKGKAVDVSCTDSKIRFKIIKEAIALGLTVGVAKLFLHLDNRRNQIIFTY